MAFRQHVEIGKATSLHYGSSSKRRSSGNRGQGPERYFALAVAAIFVVAIAFVVWFATLRTVTIEVNGQDLEVHEGSPLSGMLSANDYFGVKPGRLLSVTGEVLDEDGGDACQVTFEDEVVPTDEYADFKLAGGESFQVSDGKDAEEPSHEKTVDIEPGVKMETGGAVQYVSQWGAPGKKTVRVGETSGESVDVEVTDPQTDMVISSTNLKPSGGKYIALTFDDGPSKYTADILKILKEKGAKATFFCLGDEVSQRPDDVKAVIEAGNEVASHTMSHENLPKLDRDTLRSEITSAFDAIEKASDVKTQIIRAPYGAFTSTEWARSADLVSCNVLWNIDTLDWKRPGAAAITSAVLSNAKNGSIVLMHDGGGNREQDVEALPDIIDGLKDRGYEFVTISELIKLDGTIPDAVADSSVEVPKDAVLPSA